MSGISLTSSMRANLLSLKNTSSLIDMTQNRLSTGNKVNSAIDNPSSYYTARSLNNRANDLSSLLDSMGQAVSTIKAATTALETGAEILGQASAVAAQTLETAKPIVARVKTEEELLAAVNSGKQGFIVIENDITMSDNQNISLNDGQSLVGAKYFNKNVNETTLNFNYNASEGMQLGSPIIVANNSTISDLNFNFTSNTKEIYQNGKLIESGFLHIKDKNNVNLQNLNFNINADAPSEYRGFFAIYFDNSKGTIQGDINIETNATHNRCILGDYGSEININNAKINNKSYNGGAMMLQSYRGATININGNSQINLMTDTTYTVSGICLYGGGIINVNDYSTINVTGNAGSYSCLIDGDGYLNLNDSAKINVNGYNLFNSSCININDNSSFNVSATSIGNSNGTSININSSSASVNLDVDLSSESNISFSAVSGAKISTRQGTYDFNDNVESITFSDATLTTLGSLDTNQTAGFDAETTAMFADFSAHMADNIGAEVDNDISDSKQFASILNQYDALINDGSYKGVNLLKNESLSVRFNEDGNSKLDIAGKDMSSTTLGINTQSWQTAEDVAQSIAEIASAMKQIRSYNSELGNNYSIITSRQSFTENLINVLTEGADKLTLADMNEESANILALQTRQQLAINSLSLAAQSAQAVLKLF